MSSKKIRAGVSFDQGLAVELESHAQRLSSLQVDKSEIVNAILGDFFEGRSTAESVWEAVSKRRERRRNAK